MPVKILAVWDWAGRVEATIEDHLARGIAWVNDHRLRPVPDTITGAGGPPGATQ